MPPKGEALSNPFYAAQRFTDALGAHSVRDRVLAVPRHDAVIVLSAWHWNLSTARRESLERWVESGGRLVVDENLAGSEDEFERWTGIGHEDREQGTAASYARKDDEPCRRFQEEENGTLSGEPNSRGHWICDLDGESYLTSTSHPEWALRDAAGIQAARVHIGRGKVTVINATPYRGRSLFDGDHAWLFAAATELRRADEVHFLSEDDHPSLFALLWQYGAPVVALSIGVVILLLWRGAVRLGPLAAAAETARRSLAEQIRGVGQFAIRHGSGGSLHAASVRALDEAAQRRISSYARLSTKARADALMRITGFEWHALAAACSTRVRRAHELRNTIALLEAARRKLLTEQTRVSHETY
jgi:hypothetical protein